MSNWTNGKIPKEQMRQMIRSQMSEGLSVAEIEKFLRREKRGGRINLTDFLFGMNYARWLWENGRKRDRLYVKDPGLQG